MTRPSYARPTYGSRSTASPSATVPPSSTRAVMPPSAHGVVAAGSEQRLHAGAGVADAGVFQHGAADLEAAVAQGVQVDAGRDDVAAQQHGIGDADVQVGKDGGQALLLDQGDAAGSAGAAAVVVAEHAVRRRKVRRIGGQQWGMPGWAHADPSNPARAQWRIEQPCERGGGIEQANGQIRTAGNGWA